MMLFAALPDRLHAEVLSPVGTTVLIVDAGAGKIAITFVRERAAYVGDVSPAVLETIVGVGLPLDELVGALLTPGVEIENVEIERSADPAGLPESFALSVPPRRFGLTLKRRRPIGGTTASLGTGVPPQGMRLRGLEELERLAESVERELAESE